MYRASTWKIEGLLKAWWTPPADECMARHILLMGYVYSNPIPLVLGDMMGLQSLPGVLHALKIIIEVFLHYKIHDQSKIEKTRMQVCIVSSSTLHIIKLQLYILFVL
jgi:hypothetical protein